MKISKIIFDNGTEIEPRDCKIDYEKCISFNDCTHSGNCCPVSMECPEFRTRIMIKPNKTDTPKKKGNESEAKPLIGPGTRFLGQPGDTLMEVVKRHENHPKEWWCRCVDYETGLWLHGEKGILKNLIAPFSAPSSPSVVDLLNEILDHAIANRGTKHAFFICYSYPSGEMPSWVAKAEAICNANDEKDESLDKNVSGETFDYSVLERIKDAITELDGILTNKEKALRHREWMDNNKKEWCELFGEGDEIFYLSDDGMSRMYYDQGGSFSDSGISCLHLCLGASESVKEKWNTEDAQRIIEKLEEMLRDYF